MASKTIASLIALALLSLPFVSCYSMEMSVSPASSSPAVAVAAVPIPRKRKSVFDHFRSRGSAVDMALGISSHVGAAVTAVVELGEDLESIGHGHGMLLLVGSRLAREFNVLRSVVVEEVEELSHLQKNKWWRWPLEPFFFIGHVLSTKVIATLLACAALGAAAIEVIEDTRPGGHHGAVLLAINELWELIELAHIVPKRWRFLLHQHLLRLALVSGALVVAVIETVEETKLGAVGGHHGVAMYAFAKILRVVALMRTEIRELSEVKEERAIEAVKSAHTKKDD